LPRISADHLSTVPVAKTEFPPPAHLGNEERIVFRDVLATADKGHFRSEDRELLALYAVHVVAARRLMKLKRRNAEQQRELRATTALVVSLTTRLRLGPKSRVPDRRAQSAGLRSGFRPPWQGSEPLSSPHGVATLAEATEDPLKERWTTPRDPAA
jgi:hypothetical protein